MKKGEEGNYSVSYEMSGRIVAPRKAGDKVGEITITKDGVVVKEIDLIIKEDIEQINFSQSMKKIIKAW